MDHPKLIQIMRATMDPHQRKQAENELEQIHKHPGFAPMLLQVVMSNEVDLPVRQAGIIYLKNMVMESWVHSEHPSERGDFAMSEEDKFVLRDVLVDATVFAPDILQVQLAISLSTIIRHDFPAKWTGIVEKVATYLQGPNAAAWNGALVCLYQLVKNYEYKKAEDRTPLNQAMHLLLPMVYQKCQQLIQDQSAESVGLQKVALKIMSALVQYHLPLDLLPKNVFMNWMELLGQIVDRPVPESTLTVDEDERAELPWWKCKKWALHILVRLFERYGSPNTTTKKDMAQYEQFAVWYLQTFSEGIIRVLLKILDQYRKKMFVAPRVLQQVLNYLNTAVSFSYSWKFIKNDIHWIIQEVLFPLMCFSDSDEELWNTDPLEFIRLKFDSFEDFVSPVISAQTLLHSVAKKRKNMLQHIMEFLMRVMTSPNPNPRQKDGAMHMVGSLGDILVKSKTFKDKLEMMLVTYVFPEFNSPEGYLRARACWMVRYFCELRFRKEENLVNALTQIQRCLLADGEMPVKVEAAIAIQMMLAVQNDSLKYLKPQVKSITHEMLKIIRETENDELTAVLQKIVWAYTDDLAPIAVDMTEHLVGTFMQVIENDEKDGEKVLIAMGLLNTVSTIVSVMEKQKNIMATLEPLVLQVIMHIITNSVMELYEEAFSLVASLTCVEISANMWKVFEYLYQLFQTDGFDYFTDMMPVLHNYVTVDTPTFLSGPNNLMAIFTMCKTILTTQPGEDPESHAAKLLEVILLEGRGRVDECIPSFIELAVQRLFSEVKTSELRTMCLQVVIAALYTSPAVALKTLNGIQMPQGQQGSIIQHFVQQWIKDVDCFIGIHDRKLSVLGFCTLIALQQERPTAMSNCATQVLPAILFLFDGLKRAYAARAQEDDDDSEDEDIDLDAEVLKSDEDEIDEDTVQYLEHLERKDKHSYGDDFDDDSDYELEDETALESFSTQLDAEDCDVDEYLIFKDVISALRTNEPDWYTALTSQLTVPQQQSLEEVFRLAEQRKAAWESKRIQSSGGYQFQNQQVPQSFNFGEGHISRMSCDISQPIIR